jgi:hypothetical protein
MLVNLFLKSSSLFRTFHICSQIIVPNSTHLLQDYPMCSQIFSSVPRKNNPACQHKICSKYLLFRNLFLPPSLAPFSSHLLAPSPLQTEVHPSGIPAGGGGGGVGWRLLVLWTSDAVYLRSPPYYFNY